MLKPLILIASALMITSGASAHDFWLQPETFQPEAVQPFEVMAKVGHTEDITEWPADPARIIAFRSISETGITDIQNVLANRLSDGRFIVPGSDAGFHVLAIESVPSVSVLPAEKFNSYVEEEGVRPISEHRRMKGLMETDGREIYSRRAKAIVSTGNVTNASDSHITRPIGLTLEITPMTNPAATTPDSALVLEVRYRGAPLPNATIHVVNLDPTFGDSDQLLTDSNGLATLSGLPPGEWMLQTVWSAPISGDPRGDYDTIFSSLSFSIQGG